MTRRIRIHPWLWQIPALYLCALCFLSSVLGIWHLWDPTAAPGLGPIWQHDIVVGSLVGIGAIWLPRPQRGLRR